MGASERYCIRCREGFPVSPEGVGWLMGWMRPLKDAPQKIKDVYLLAGGVDSYLCGNCYFDLKDDY